MVLPLRQERGGLFPPAIPHSKPHRTTQRYKRCPQEGEVNTLRKQSHSRVAHHAQGRKTATGQNAEAEAQGVSVFLQLWGAGPLQPPLQLKEQLLLTLQPADNKTSTPDHLALEAPHLADQGIVCLLYTSRCV